MTPRVVWAASAVVVGARYRSLRERLSRHRHQVTSALLVVTGMAGALGGGFLIGVWCLGLVMLAESAGMIALGLMRDDGQERPILGARTVEQILDDERLRP